MKIKPCIIPPLSFFVYLHLKFILTIEDSYWWICSWWSVKWTNLTYDLNLFQHMLFENYLPCYIYTAKKENKEYKFFKTIKASTRKMPIYIFLPSITETDIAASAVNPSLSVAVQRKAYNPVVWYVIEYWMLPSVIVNPAGTGVLKWTKIKTKQSFHIKSDNSTFMNIHFFVVYFYFWSVFINEWILKNNHRNVIKIF